MKEGIQRVVNGLAEPQKLGVSASPRENQVPVDQNRYQPMPGGNGSWFTKGQ